jgi:hypothetical protein
MMMSRLFCLPMKQDVSVSVPVPTTDVRLRAVPPEFTKKDTCPYMARIQIILTNKWVRHVEMHSKLYDQLMIRNVEEIARVPFIRFDRTIGEQHPWDGSICFRPIPKLREIICYTYEIDDMYAICKDVYQDDAWKHLEWTIRHAVLIQSALKDMDTTFPFACRYYKCNLNHQPFINPMPEDISKIQSLFKTVLENPISSPFANGDIREYAHWFVETTLAQSQTDPEFFDPIRIFHNALRLSEYLHESVLAHYKHVLRMSQK